LIAGKIGCAPTLRRIQMLTDHNKELLLALEAKYVSMLDLVSDFAGIDMGNAPEQSELEKYILSMRQEIHETASKLNNRK
jgi:hypothetical protein